MLGCGHSSRPNLSPVPPVMSGGSGGDRTAGEQHGPVLQRVSSCGSVGDQRKSTESIIGTPFYGHSEMTPTLSRSFG